MSTNTQSSRYQNRLTLRAAFLELEALGVLWELEGPASRPHTLFCRALGKGSRSFTVRDGRIARDLFEHWVRVLKRVTLPRSL